MKALTKAEIKLARNIGMSADALQILLFPFFGEGFLSPFNDLLDVVVCILLTQIIGWHWAFVPTFFFEEMPGLDEVPTWTLAVMLATHNRPVASRDESRPLKAPTIIETEIEASRRIRH